MTTENIITKTFTIPHSAQDRVRVKVAALAKRATRKGFSPPSVTFSAPALATAVREDGGHVKYLACEATLTFVGPKLCLNGYHLVSRVDNLPTETAERTVIFNTVPGKELTQAERDKTRTMECDHCHTRRLRNHVFVLRHEDGHSLVVGSTCLEDFLGHSASGLMEFFTLLDRSSDLDEPLDTEVLMREGFDMLSVLAHAVMNIRTKGWRSAGQHFEDGRGCTKLDTLETLTRRV